MRLTGFFQESPMPLKSPKHHQESSIEIAARSCVIASMDAVQQLALELKKMPRVAGGLKS